MDAPRGLGCRSDSRNTVAWTINNPGELEAGEGGWLDRFTIHGCSRASDAAGDGEYGATDHGYFFRGSLILNFQSLKLWHIHVVCNL